VGKPNKSGGIKMDLSINRWVMDRDRFLDGLERLGITELHISVAKSAAERIVNSRIEDFQRVCLWLFSHEPSMQGAKWLRAWDIVHSAIGHWKREEQDIDAQYFMEPDPNQLVMFDRRPRWAMGDRKI
jgi:hypothetical protein